MDKKPKPQERTSSMEDAVNKLFPGQKLSAAEKTHLLKLAGNAHILEEERNEIIAGINSFDKEAYDIKGEWLLSTIEERFKEHETAAFVSPSNALSFSKNWNNKLDCEVFTSIRLATNKWVVDNEYAVFLNQEQGHPKQVATVKLLLKKKIYIQQINDWMAYLDTGTSADECRRILRALYPPSIDWNTQFVYHMLFQKFPKSK